MSLAPKDIATINAILAMHNQGAFAADVCEAFGLGAGKRTSYARFLHVLRCLGVEIFNHSVARPKGATGPKARALAEARRMVARVPAWVPDDLVDRYIKLARRDGEEDAASEIRRVKRERAQQHGAALTRVRESV